MVWDWDLANTMCIKVTLLYRVAVYTSVILLDRQGLPSTGQHKRWNAGLDQSYWWCKSEFWIDYWPCFPMGLGRWCRGKAPNGMVVIWLHAYPITAPSSLPPFPPSIPSFLPPSPSIPSLPSSFYLTSPPRYTNAALRQLGSHPFHRPRTPSDFTIEWKLFHVPTCLRERTCMQWICYHNSLQLHQETDAIGMWTSCKITWGHIVCHI